jgi:hypothetical protein
VVLVCLPLAAAFATVAAAASGVVRATTLDYAEPVVYGQAMRLLHGQPLYQPIDTPPLTVAAYTPLYYWLAAGLQAIVGGGFGPGRLLSLICGTATAVMVGGLAGRKVGGVWVGAFAAALFLALGFPRDRDDAPWLGLYRVDMLGVALSIAAICILVWRRSAPALLAAGVLAGLAILTKQTFVAAAIAGGVWLTVDRPKPTSPLQPVWFVGAVIFTVAIPCLLLEASTGAFFQNALEANVNPFYLVVGAGLVSVLVRTQWLPLLLVGVYLALGRPWLSSQSRLLVLYWAASSLFLFGIAKIGANYNYWIEFVAASAILAAHGASCLVSIARPRVAALSAAGLILLVGVQLGGPTGLQGAARAARSDVSFLFARRTNAEFGLLVDRVRNEPGIVLAEPMDVLVLGGRQVAFEPFIYSVRLDMGRWRADELVAHICDGDVRLVVLGYPIEVGANMSDGLHALWPRPVMAALRSRMMLDGLMAERYVYVPGPASGGECRANQGYGSGQARHG